MEVLIYCTSSSTLDFLIYCILYVAMNTHVTFCISHVFMAIVLLCIWDCYMYLQSHAEIDHCIVLIRRMGLPLGSSSLHFWDGLIMYFVHHMTPLTSHIRGNLLQLILPHMVDHTFMAFPVPLQTL